jgi:threonyl-tRNA synthetase
MFNEKNTVVEEQAPDEVKEENLHALRHSTAHVMAQAVLETFPEGKIAIGPPIEDGFYYDFDLPRPLTPDDLVKIEARMKEIIRGRWPFIRKEVSADEARRIFVNQPYKLELIDGLEKGTGGEHGTADEAGALGAAAGPAQVITIYEHNGFVDLCRGPHVSHTGYIKPNAFKLLRTAGAYWRGDEKRPMLQRIYGTVWPSKARLETYLQWLAEIEKRDHRRLGRELDLFHISPDLGGGLVLWLPKGGLIRKVAEDFCREVHQAHGYEFVYSPHIGRAWLWETSGHLSFYKDNMYAPLDIEGQQYFLKPMNCPFHILMVKSRRRSYREFPMRYAEWGTVYRFERSGVLHGLMRVRGFTQDDAHIFCRPDQVEDEILKVLDFSIYILNSFGFYDFNIELSVRDPNAPEKYAGTDEEWQMAERALARALNTRGLPYRRAEGEAVFYGPKIDMKIKDAIGRSWQCTTIQFDFNLPRRFDLSYQAADGSEQRPYMVHRALLGSMERFFGVLIEHYAGAFPVWLAPVQAVVIPVADRHNDYAQQVGAQLRAAGLRVEVDTRSERMNAKVRDAQLQKVPYILVVGDREAETGAVSLRLRTEENLGAMPLPAFVERAQAAIAGKKLL